MKRKPVKRRAFIVNTNVLVSGLLTQDVESKVAQIFDGVQRAAFPFVLSNALLTEYRAVLVRPKIRARHGLTVAEVDDILTELAQHAIVLELQPATSAPDPGAQFLWDLLTARPDLLLVTGHKRLQNDAQIRGRVIAPLTFVDTGNFT